MTAPVRLRLVRHGRAASSFAEAQDPGLDDTGRAQAEAVAARLAPLGPLPIITSPLRRTRETAEPLERRWSRRARLEPAVAEIPSCSVGLDQRGEWLRGIMLGRWPDLDDDLQAWRRAVLAALASIREPTVIVSHFVAINVVVGEALGDDRVIVFQPDNGSVTVVEVLDGRIRLLKRGEERASPML